MFLANGTHLKETQEGAELETTALLAAIIRHQKPTWCLETGTAHGQTAEAIGRALKANGKGHLWSCDIDQDRCIAARKRCAGLPVEVWCQTGESLIRSSTEAECGRQYHFVFIDSWWCPVRIEEVELVVPHIAEGGFLAMHDVSQNYRAVYDRARALCPNWEQMMFPAPYGLGILRRPSPKDDEGLGRPVELTEVPDEPPTV